jgi:hypothetical protein
MVSLSSDCTSKDTAFSVMRTDSLSGNYPVDRRSNTKRSSGLVKLLKDSACEAVGVSVTQGVGRWPQQKRVTRRPDLAESGIDGVNDLVSMQNLGKGTRVSEDKKPADDKNRGLGIRSRRAVWVDGPTLRALMFGDSE